MNGRGIAIATWAHLSIYLYVTYPCLTLYYIYIYILKNILEIREKMHSGPLYDLAKKMHVEIVLINVLGASNVRTAGRGQLSC